LRAAAPFGYLLAGGDSLLIHAHATTVLGVRRNGHIAFAADGQITIEEAVVKSSAHKIMKVFNGQVLVGFAGASADAMALLERFENKLEEARGRLPRAVQELARDWRTDRVLRHLEALLLVADKQDMFLISGRGDVIEVEEDAAGIGSGGSFALAAAKALLRHSRLSAENIARESLQIAASICVYTNENITVLTL